MNVVSRIALAFLERTLAEGKTIEIPSLGIVIGGKDAAVSEPNVFTDTLLQNMSLVEITRRYFEVNAATQQSIGMDGLDPAALIAVIEMGEMQLRQRAEAAEAAVRVPDVVIDGYVNYVNLSKLIGNPVMPFSHWLAEGDKEP